MAITLDGTTFQTRRPEDLDAALLQSTGCNAAEVLKGIQDAPLVGRLAAALAPFLDDTAPSLPELAVMIESELTINRQRITADIQRLITAPTAPTAPDKEPK